MKEHSAPLDGASVRIGVVAARFNEMIVSSLFGAALTRLRRLGVSDDDVEVVRVPGAMEVPLAARALAATGRVDAIVALGAVIRGATPHFDHVAGQAAAGCSAVALETGVPVIFGVLTTDTIEQAIERAGTKAGNRGADAAEAAIEMANVLRSVAE